MPLSSEKEQVTSVIFPLKRDSFASPSRTREKHCLCPAAACAAGVTALQSRYFWGTAAADSAGSRNYAGIKDAAVDALIEKIIEAPDRQKLIAATRALDRVLLWNWYVVPHWHVPANRLVFWNKFGYPTARLTKGVQLTTWWADGAKEASLAAKRAKKREKRKTVFEQVRELL